MNRFLRKVQLSGTNDRMTIDEANVIINVNLVILWMSLLSSVIMVVFAALSYWFVSFMILLHILVFLSGIALNYLELYKAAKVLFVLELYAGIYLLNGFLGSKYYMDMLLLSSIAVPFVLTNNDEWGIHIIGITLGITGVYIFNYTPVAQWNRTHEVPEFVRYFLILVAFLIPYLSLRQFKRTNRRFSSRLDLRTQELEETLAELILRNEQIQHQNFRLNKAISERETLLKEIHHRVKNNMQIITSLLNMQQRELNHPELTEAIEQSKLRIASMAAVHQILYKADDFNKLDFTKYLNELIELQIRSLSGERDKIKWTVKAENIFFNIDTSMPLGIMITEIITNAAKHAFNDHSEGSIYIEIDRNSDNHYQMKIGDNGNGLPDHIEPESLDTMGFTLIYSLIDQVNGMLEIDDSRQGTHYIIKFEEV